MVNNTAAAQADRDDTARQIAEINEEIATYKALEYEGDPGNYDAMLDTPNGHNQRMAYLLVSVALHQAREQRARYSHAREQVEAGGHDAFARSDRLNNDRSTAESRLATIPWAEPEALATRLADALVWAKDSKIAAERLPVLIDSYANVDGLRIDPSSLTVAVDAEFDAQVQQACVEAAIVYTREGAAHDMLKAVKLPEEVWAAIAPVPDGGLTPETAQAYLDTATSRRDRLTVALNAANLDPMARSSVEFAVDYLRGQTDDLDLTKTPILIDPAEEVRGRVPELLDLFAKHGRTVGATIAHEIAVMTPADQERVKAAGHAIVAAGGPVDHQLWPDEVDRDDLISRVWNFADETAAVADYAEDWAIQTMPGAATGFVPDEILHRVAKLGEDRAALRTALDRDGLHPIEKAALTAVVAEIDAGRRMGYEALPQLMLVDERTKQRIDQSRHLSKADKIGERTYDHAIQVLTNAKVDLSEYQGIDVDLKRVGGHIEYLAQGGHTPAELKQRRGTFDRDMKGLGRELADAGVPMPIRHGVKEVIDTNTRIAGLHGKARAEREQLWEQRIGSSAAAAARKADANRQRNAAAAGRAKPAARACVTRPTPAAASSAVPTKAGARLSRLHNEEVAR
ncbi:hypothetical protein ACFQZZ_33245 [Nocardia sp. GCM10030253]|uniref:hypothetical protein n=1 Tax=Nocardia sp. GCM10030253 TaxID=3273404 RepID=UPI00362B5E76